MGRYAYNSAEVLYREDKLVGINTGYGYYAEHEFGYHGAEMERQQGGQPLEDHPFSKEFVRNPDVIKLVEFDTGKFWLTNDMHLYRTYMQKNEQERKDYLNGLLGDNSDKNSYESFISGKLRATPNSPEIVSLWDSDSFNLLSGDEKNNALLQRLYEEMQRKNVAISSDYSFIFKDRGLSFVLVDQLSPEDLQNKNFVDNYRTMAKQYEKEYNRFLKDEGLEGLFGGSKYPIEFWNVQIHKLLQTDKGIMPQFYLEIVDTSKGREELDENCMHDLPSHMTGAEIKFLVPIVQSPEYAEFAKSHSKEEIAEYLNSQLEIHKQNEQEIANSTEIQEEDYTIDESSLGAVATQQKESRIKSIATRIKGAVAKWLHPDKDKLSEKTEEKGE